MHCAEGRCDLCAKELADDLEVVNKGLDLSIPEEHRGFGNNSLWVVLVTAAVEIRRPFANRRAKRAFERRTAEEIRQWRVRAGIVR
jgi:hypothetical protein